MKHKPLNLGQGFPDFAPPDHITEALAATAKGDNILLHQYTRGYVIFWNSMIYYSISLILIFT